MERRSRNDGYVNMVNKVGTGKDPLENYSYQLDDPTPDVELGSIYAGGGLFAGIIDKPSELALKNGYDLGIGDADLTQRIEKKLRNLHWSRKAAEALKWARLFGGAAILIGVDDGGDWDDPVDMDSVTRITDLVVFERPEVQPDYISVLNRSLDVSNMNRMDKPEYYFVNPIYGGASIRVHESRLLIFRNGKLPRTSAVNTDYMFFGVPEYNRIKRELRDTVTTHGNGYRLLERCVQAVYKMKHLSGLMATEDGEDDVIRRMQLIDMARSLLNTMVIDADGEDYSFQSFQLSGVKDIIDESCNLLSAVTNIPQTVLFGRSPAGENATGEGDLTNYYDYVGQIQEMNLTDNLQYLLNLILTAYVNTGKIKSIPQMDLKPNPLWSKSEKEQAELDNSRAQARLSQAQATQIYVDMQAVDPKEVRRQLAESDDYQIDDVLSGDDLDSDLGIEELLKTYGAGSTGSGALQGAAGGAEPDKGEMPGEDGEKQNDDGTDEPRSRGAAVIVIRDGKILCGCRSDDGSICGPGGHVESGEDARQAAIRETQEEFGITPGYMVPIGEYAGGGEYLPSDIFLTNEYSGRVAADDDEMLKARWMSLEELANEKLFPPFEAGLKMLIERLTGPPEG